MSKSIIITGGGRGIGAAVAKLCGARGWSVAISYAENAEAAAATAAAVKAAGGKAFIHKGHVAVEAEVVALFDAAASAFGGIDGVVNNAGVLAPASPLADITLERLHRIFDVNVLGAYLVAREAARRMSTSRGGRGGVLINLSSAAAKLGAPGSPEGFDPALHAAPATFDASSAAVYDRLVAFEKGTTKPAPGLATAWDISEDGLEYTFHLRPGVKFQTTAYFTPSRDLNAD